jgi:hypothetical protein
MRPRVRVVDRVRPDPDVRTAVKGRLGFGGRRIAHVIAREPGLLDGANSLRPLLRWRLRHAGKLGLGDLVLVGEASRQGAGDHDERKQAKPNHVIEFSKNRSSLSMAAGSASASEDSMISGADLID